MTSDPFFDLGGNEPVPRVPQPARPSVTRMAVWDFAGRIFNFGITFIIGVLLTRILAPEDFGIFAVILAIVLFSNVFLDFGFRIALVQAKTVDQTQLSTVFFLNLIVAAAIFSILALSAPAIAAFYGNEALSLPLVVLCGLFLTNALMLIPNVLLSRALRFRSIAISTSIAAVVSGTLGVTLAYSGYGLWALVAQTLVNSAILLLGVGIGAAWLPSFTFVLSSVRSLTSLSSTFFFLTLLDSFYSRLDVFIIGKLFDMNVVGFYGRAQSIDGLVRNFSVGTLGSIILPYFSQIQDDLDKLRHYYVRSVNLVLFIAFMSSGVLFLGADDIVIILFTEKWAIVASYFRIIALTSFAYPVSVIMVNIIVARGNAGEFIKLELVKRVVLTPVFAFLYFRSIYGFLLAQLVAILITLNLNAHFVQREIGISKTHNLKMTLRYALPAVACGLVSYALSYRFRESYSLHLLIVLATFPSLYILIGYYFKVAGLTEAISRMREILPKGGRLRI